MQRDKLQMCKMHFYSSCTLVEQPTYMQDALLLLVHIVLAKTQAHSKCTRTTFESYVDPLLQFAHVAECQPRLIPCAQESTTSSFLFKRRHIKLYTFRTTCADLLSARQVHCAHSRTTCGPYVDPPLHFACDVVKCQPWRILCEQGGAHSSSLFKARHIHLYTSSTGNPPISKAFNNIAIFLWITTYIA